MRDDALQSDFDPTRPPPVDDLVDRALALVGRHRRAFLAAGAAFQVLFLLGMVATYARPHLDPESRSVLLRVIPVDPRDLLRGDYVILSYDVSRPSDVPVGPGATVYVGLKPDKDGQHYVADGASAVPFTDGRVFLKGTFQGGNRVTYGIESYYVQEGKGHDYENAVRDRRLSAEVIVAPDGTASLRALRIE